MNLLLRKPKTRDLIDAYLAELEALNRSPHTIRSYRETLAQWDRSGVTPKTFLQHQSERGAKPRSVNTRRAILHAYFAWLERNAYARDNPVSRTGRVKVPKRLRPTLTVKQVASLIDACGYINGHVSEPSGEKPAGSARTLPIAAYRARLAAMVAVQVTSGLRISELCSIETSRVDLSVRTVTVIRKGDKEQALRFGKVAHAKILAWYAFRETLPGPYLFCTLRGSRVAPRNYTHQLRQACGWAEIPQISPHALRRTFATLAVDSGIPMRDVQEMLGHTHITTTESYIERREGDAWKRYDSHVLEAQVNP